MFTKKTSLIIPTKNRPYLLSKLLFQLKKLRIKFNEIIIVDSSDKQFKNEVKYLSQKYKCKMFTTKSSTSYQRNFGIKKKSKKSKYIMFLDDDIFFKKKAFANMDKALKANFKINLNILGYGFNQVNNLKLSYLDIIKKSKFTSFLGLYSDKPGKVLRSGWQTKIVNLKTNLFTDLMHSAAIIIPIVNLKSRFDLNLGSYSYLEDLDFSINMRKKNKSGKFLLVSSAQFNHPNNIDRIDFNFGKVEFLNRFWIVQKYNYDFTKFFYIALVKIVMSFFSALLNFKKFPKFFGNITGLCSCLKQIFLKKNK